MTSHAAAPPRPVMALHRPHLPSPARALPYTRFANPNLRRLPLLRVPRRARIGPRIAASVAVPAPVESDSRDMLERCFSQSPESGPPSCSATAASGAAAPVMKGGKYGAFGATTLEKSKLDMSQKTTRTSPEVRG